jgi:hypothetical protein
LLTNITTVFPPKERDQFPPKNAANSNFALTLDAREVCSPAQRSFPLNNNVANKTHASCA